MPSDPRVGNLTGMSLPSGSRAAALIALAALLPGATAAWSPSAHAASRRASIAPAAPDTVRGVVFDSLANAPLADAFIFAEPGGVSVTADSLGRFTLVGEATITRLTVYHPALDEIGLGALVVARPEGVARWDSAVAATPSLATIWERVCRAEMPAGENRGVLVGSARLPDDRTRVAGAAIRVQWEEILPRTRLRQLEERDAVTDSTGGYAVCGVPAMGDMAMIGLSTELQSGALQVALEQRPLRRVDLVLAPADGPVDRWPTIVGRVIGPDQQPVPNAEVAIDGVDSAVVAGADGRFTIAKVPPGSRMLAAQAAGYVAMAQQVDVLFEGTPEVIVALDRGLAIAGLEGIAVTERRVIRRDREEFEARRAEGIATFVDTTAIREAGSLRAALAAVPGLELRTAPGETDEARFAIYGYGRNLGVTTCRATVLVDGLPATLAELHAISAEQFAAVEVYRSEAYAPARFGEFVQSDCALVIFWTQFGLRP